MKSRWLLLLVLLAAFAPGAGAAQYCIVDGSVPALEECAGTPGPAGPEGPAGPGPAPD